MEGGHVFPGLCVLAFSSFRVARAHGRRSPEVQFALQRVSAFHPINLCNALFIAFLCNYSVIRLCSVQFFMANIVFHCIPPLVGQVFATLVCVSSSKPV